MDEKGVFAVARSIWSDPCFDDEPFTEREAWMWLVGAAAWKDVRTRGNAGAVELKRGEFSFSVRFLMRKWRWENKDRVHRFLKRLEKRDSIRDTSRDGAQVYLIAKYKDYQVVGLPNRDTDCDSISDASATAPRQHRDKEETLETLNIKIEEEGAPVGASGRSKPKLVKQAIVYPLWLPTQAWAAFVDFRKSKDRKGWTEHAERLSLRKLEQLANQGHDPTSVLEQSVMRGWTGLFPIKPDNDNGRSGHKAAPHRDFLDAGLDVAREYLGTGRDEGDDSGSAYAIGRPLLPP